MLTHCALYQWSMGSKYPGNKVRIAEAGGIDAILKGMSAHTSHARVQEQACRALCSVSVDTDNKVKGAEAGGTEIILRGMAKHLDHAGVQEQACRALWVLGVNTDNRVKIDQRLQRPGGSMPFWRAWRSTPSTQGCRTKHVGLCA